MIEAAGTLIAYLSNKDLVLDWKSLMFNHPADCLNLLAVLTNKSREEVDLLDPEQAIGLLLDVAELNLDFFVRTVLPRLSGGLKVMFEDAAQTLKRLTPDSGQGTSTS